VLHHTANNGKQTVSVRISKFASQVIYIAVQL